MNNEEIFEVDWSYILACLAETAGIVSVSDVALLKRFRRCGPWLGHLVLQKIAERSQWSCSYEGDLRIRIVDATHLSSPGAKGTNWRLHLGLDLGSLMVDHFEFTDWRVGESFDRFPVIPNELLVGDRGYAHRDPMARVANAGGFFLVRLPWSVVPLNASGDIPFDLFGFLRSIPEAEARESAVSFVASDDSIVKCRLIVLRKSAACAEASRKKVLSEKSRKCRSIDPRSLEAAEYIILLTNLEADKLSCHQALEIQEPAQPGSPGRPRAENGADLRARENPRSFTCRRPHRSLPVFFSLGIPTPS